METGGNEKWKYAWTWILLIFLVIFSNAGVVAAASEKSSSVQITNLLVPHSIENGTQEYIILDCEFNLEGNNTNILVVTWIWNDDKIIYKWIPGSKSRHPFGFLKDRMDMSYSASSIPWEKYRALKISNPTTEVSGKYTCDISTEAGHATESSELIVYSKPKEYEIKVATDPSEDHINVTCWAIGGYPKPSLSLSYEVDRNRVKVTDVEEGNTRSAGAYDVWIHTTLETRELPSSTKISCDIKIPNTSYLARKEVAVTGYRSRLEDIDSSTAPPLRIRATMIIIVLTVFMAQII